MERILLVDDDPAVTELVRRVLGGAGFGITVARTATGGVQAARTSDPDLILLDLLLPDDNGDDMIGQLLTNQPETPIVVLSAVTETAAKVRALDRGAVDYIEKPFTNGDLIARVRTRLLEPRAATTQLFPPAPDRTISSATTSEASTFEPVISDGLIFEGTISDGDLPAQVARWQLIKENFSTSLSPRQLMLLAYLLDRRPCVSSRQEIAAAVWGMTDSVGARMLVDVAVRRLRRKLPSGSIESVGNIGYRLDPSRQA